MLPRDKYTMFDRKAKKYRKGIHSTFCLAPYFCPTTETTTEMKIGVPDHLVYVQLDEEAEAKVAPSRKLNRTRDQPGALVTVNYQ